MAEVGPSPVPVVVIGGGGDSRADNVRSERREAVREEARANFEQATRMVTDYVNRTSPPRSREDFAQIRQFVRSFYSAQALNNNEVDHIMLRLFPDVDPGLMGVANPEPAPNQPNPLADARTDANPKGPDPRDARPDTGADRFVKNPNLPNAQPLVARGVPADAPPPPPPAGAPPPPPPPGAPVPAPRAPGVPADAAPLAPVIATALPDGTALPPGSPVVPGSPEVVPGSPALPPGSVKHFSRGEAPLRPGTGPSQEAEENLQTLAMNFRAKFTSGRDATIVGTSPTLAQAAGTFVVGRMAGRTSSTSGKGSADRRTDRAEGEGEGGEGGDTGVSDGFVKLAFTRGRYNGGGLRG